VRAAAAVGENDPIGRPVELREQLARGVRVGERPDRRRAADGHRVRARTELLGERGDALLQPSPVPRAGELDGRAEQPVEDQVAAVLGGLVAREHEVAGEPTARGRRGRHACEVRLRAAGRDQRVAAARERVGDQRLELARLVAAEREPGQVVALDQHAHAEHLRQPRRLVERRRRVDEPYARPAHSVASRIRAAMPIGTVMPITEPMR
jgi:hypothetical protein